MPTTKGSKTAPMMIAARASPVLARATEPEVEMQPTAYSELRKRARTVEYCRPCSTPKNKVPNEENGIMLISTVLLLTIFWVSRTRLPISPHVNTMGQAICHNTVAALPPNRSLTATNMEEMTAASTIVGDGVLM